MDLGYEEVTPDLEYEVALNDAAAAAATSGGDDDNKNDKEEDNDDAAANNKQVAVNNKEGKDEEAKDNSHSNNVATKTTMQELSMNMRRASIAYRRASLEMRRASLCHTTASNKDVSGGGAAAAAADGMLPADQQQQFYPGTTNDPTCFSRRGSNASMGGWSAASTLTIDSAIPWEYDLGYGETTTNNEAAINNGSSVGGGNERRGSKCTPDDDGNISQLSFRNRRASIEYRRASMALRRASSCGSRRASVCSGMSRSSKQQQQQQQIAASSPPPSVSGGNRRDSVSTVGSDLPTGVYFGEVEILEFPLIKGDNPAAKAGCPTTLDWKPVSHRVDDVVYYEYTRGTRRSRKELKIPKEDRTFYLLSIGYTMDEIIDTEDECRKVRKQRYQTIKGDLKESKDLDNAFKKVFNKAYSSLENSVKDHKSFLRFVPDTVEKMGRRVSSAVTTTTNRLSFSSKKHQVTQEPQPPFQIAAAVAAST